MNKTTEPGSFARAATENILTAPDTQPIRHEFWQGGALGQAGEALAAETAPALVAFAPFRLRHRIDENRDIIRKTYLQLLGDAQGNALITPAAEWILDNHHAVDEAARHLRRDLTPRMYRNLPLIGVAGGAEVPRALAIAWRYISITNSSVSSEGLTEFVEGFQSRSVLDIRELWAIPAMLRFVLLENLRRLAIRVEISREKRALANRLADDLAGAAASDIPAKIASHPTDRTHESFTAQLLYRLRESEDGTVLAWLQEGLDAQGLTADQVIAAEQGSQSSGNVTVGNIIRSLRAVDDVDWLDWFETVSRVNTILSQSAGYTQLDRLTRNEYRNVVERLARRSSLSETEVAEKVVGAPQGIDPGVALLGEGFEALARACGYRPSWGESLLTFYRRLGWIGVVLPVVLLTLALAATLAGVAVSAGAWMVLFLLALLPASDAAMALVNFAAGRLLRPDRLPGYNFEGGIPDDCRTLVVIPCMLTSRDDIDDLVRNLELHYLANPRGAVDFALLSDWVDHTHETRGDDEVLLAHARAQIDALAERYHHDGGRRFFLMHRRRIHNPGEGVWMGWERKRGKLVELNALLRGEDDTTFLDTGPRPGDTVRYVLTLDSDTRLTRGSIAALVGKIAHPVNRPVLSADGRRIVAGHGLLQPRVTPSLTTGAEASMFQRIFSAHRGFDPYVFTVSDLYQDLLHEGSFTGKGLYDIDAFRAVTEGVIAENTVLSHDLLEGALARSALVTDVQFVEDFPVQYHVDAARQHRWIRGDWQLLSYAFGPRAPVGGLGRMKMIDNLRRSLVPIGWLAASVAGWLALGWSGAVLWQSGLLLLLMAGPVLAFLSGLHPQDPSVRVLSHLRVVADDARNFALTAVLRLASVPDQALTSADAILRTLYRVLVSRRHLLEWRTAGQVASGGRDSLRDYARRMAGSPVIALLAIGLVVALNPAALVVAIPVAGLWLVSPAIAWAISRTEETEDRLQIRPEDARVLRRTARLTWAFFEDFVSAGTNHLPPDNHQDSPVPKLAERTSPTNIGLYLLAIVSAREFGWISLREALARLTATLATVERLPKHRGHLYNWYDTRDLSILQPHYVSAVDSGNLAAHLVTLSASLRDWAEGSEVHLPPDPRGIGDVLDVLRQQMADLPDDRKTLRPLRRRVEERIEGFAQSYATYLNEQQLAPVRGLTLSVVARDVEKLARALDSEVATQATSDLVRWAEALVAACMAVIDDTGDRDTAQIQAQMLTLAERARALAFRMDFGFLMDPAKRLMTIGYRVDTGKADQSFYDLLASEARLASFFGIAKGDLPNEHWFRLGRPVTTVRTTGVLLSWSGSMFEYLMPPLVMKERVGGILNQSNLGAVRCQIDAARGTGAPWGVSESAMNARDAEMNYQYYAFGVQALALKRTDGADRVIAPYATLLASQLFPREAVRNLERLDRLGARGRHGYFDAIDLTPQRLPEGQTHAVVRTVMAHHQGMAIAAIANAVLEGIHRERFHADPVVQAAELLLQEKAPREVVPVTRPAAQGRTMASDHDRPPITQTVIKDTVGDDRAIALLSNGQYSRMMTSRGSGWSRMGSTAILRWKGDPSCETDGNFIFLRDVATGRWWSATAAPKTDPDQTASAIFSDHKAEFTKTVGTLETHLECIVAYEADAEGQRLTIRNNGPEPRHIEVTTYGEIVLDAEAADRTHPAFGKMFVETAISADGTTITARRHQRDHGKDGPYLAHLICDGDGLRNLQAETDRRAFLGRGRGLSHPAAFDPGAELSGSQGYTMDPIFALRRRVRVGPGKEVVLTFWTMVAPDEAGLQRAIGHYRTSSVWEHESRLAWTRSQIELRRNGSSLDEIAVFRDAAAHLIFPDLRLAAPDAALQARGGRQSELWPLGISGDVPIIVLRLDTEEDLPIARKSLRMMEYCRGKGLQVDLVLLNEQRGSYSANLQHALVLLSDSAARIAPAGARRSVFPLQRDQLDPRHVDNLLASARIVLHARNGTWSDQLARLAVAAGGKAPQAHPLLLPAPAGKATAATAAALDFPEEALEFPNGFGGFADDGRTYVIRLRHGEATPHPWINVIARNDFGFHVPAEGGGFTWAANSRDYQITPWSNDTVENRPGEGLAIRDRATGRIATPFSALSQDPSALYETRHSPGRSVFRSWTQWIEIEAVQELAAEGPAKLTHLSLHNRGNAALDLDCLAWAELVQGNNRPAAAPMIRVRLDSASGALLAENGWNSEYGGRVSALACDRRFTAVRADRGALFDPLSGKLRSFDPDLWPSGAEATETLGDPCLAGVLRLSLAPGERADLTLALADSKAEEMQALLARLFARPQPAALGVASLPAPPADLPKGPTREWDEILSTLQVKTPDRRFDMMVNTWLPYQCLSCRVRARSAFYQASGAYGFRDQLQDTAAMILHDPGLARAQILAAAGRQFPEGDVQHWWLPATGAGVRTLISDDVVWLAHSVARYVALTGDRAVLDERLPYIEGPALAEGQHDAFYQPQTSGLTESLFDHCARALDLAVKRTSERGIPLILGGDWNDGMNRVGVEGRGESVWLGWFLCATVDAFAPLAEARGAQARAAVWRAHRDRVAQAIDTLAWDGAWYQRGSFDDGTPLGSAGAAACEIDSIAQSWAAISGAAPKDRAQAALDAALARLNDREAGVMRLFTPPFTGQGPDPGYIAAYPPGVRENGGQYTHAATWMVYALARAGRGDEAFALFDQLNPISHALTREAAERYRVEPYVVAADIYGHGDKTGRGGWTWYTGAAGWLYRAAVEGILGIVADGPDAVTVTPALPAAWDGFTATLRRNGRSQQIEVRRNAGGTPEVTITDQSLAEVRHLGQR